MKISTCRLIVLVTAGWLSSFSINSSAASWISCKFSNEGCVEVLGKSYNRDEVNQIFDICQEIGQTPVDRFVSPYDIDWKGSHSEIMASQVGFWLGDQLSDLGVRFRYEDSGDPARSKLTLTKACNTWILALDFLIRSARG